MSNQIIVVLIHNDNIIYLYQIVVTVINSRSSLNNYEQHKYRYNFIMHIAVKL